jgi:DNA-binding transcriptional ArsR family regulator
MAPPVKRPLPEIVSAKKIRAVRNGLPASEVLGEAAEVFKVFASPVRISIMHALAHDELTVGDLARALGLSLSVTSHQLALLRRMRLVASRDEGRLTHYRATDELVGHLVHDCLIHVGAMLRRKAPPHHHAHDVPRPLTKMPARLSPRKAARGSRRT